MLLVLAGMLCSAASLRAQNNNNHTAPSARSLHEARRYNQMNLQGTWNVGLNVSPVVGISHPLATSGRTTAIGFCGVGIEGGYFVLDNLRLYAELSYVDNSYKNMFVDGGYDQLSAFGVVVGAQWHVGRFALGGGLLMGNTRYTVVPSILEEPIATVYRDKQRALGLSYEASYMLSPFFKVGGFYRPMLGAGRYAHTMGLRATIYLPFMDAVVCK